MSLVFYDTETTGLEASFHQVLQFAAIRTDADLKEIERFETRCRLLPHVVPAPSAMHVNGITVAQLTDQSLPSHYEMVRAIRAKLLSWSPCNFVGYNSIGFDEHFIRHAFYQTLHHPYLTNSAGNTRSDVMRMVQASSLFAPGTLTIPIDDDGLPVFKLEKVAKANGFTGKRSHDAMRDVEATIFVSRLLFDKAPDVWSAAMRFSKKAAVLDFIECEPMFSLSDFYFGKPYSWLVTLIGANATNGSERYVFNLGVDPTSLIRLKPAQLVVRLEELPKPIRSLRCNAAPILMPASDAPRIASGIGLDPEELDRRTEVLRSDGKFRDRLIAAFEATREEKVASPYVEEQIYDAFTCDEDFRLLEDFHRVAWGKRAAVLGRLKDARLKILGQQLIYIEQPEVLDRSARDKHYQTVTLRLLGTVNGAPWLTLPQAIKEIELLLASAGERDGQHLREHHSYLLHRLKDAKATRR